MYNIENPIQLNELNLFFGDRAVLRSITLEIPKGELYYLLGANGGGKSTLFKILSKQIAVDPAMVENMPKKCKMLSQNPENSIYRSLTVEENCRLFSQGKKNDRKELLEHLSLFHSTLPSLFYKRAALLSGGQKQALALALALIDPPDLLLLDEHTSALDPNASEKLMEITVRRLKQMKTTALIITHNLEHIVKYPGKVIGLKEGRVAIDKEVITKEKAQTLFQPAED